MDTPAVNLEFQFGVKGILTHFILRVLSKLSKFEFMVSICSSLLSSTFLHRNQAEIVSL